MVLFQDQRLDFDLTYLRGFHNRASLKKMFHPNTEYFMEAAVSLTTLEAIVSHEDLNI